MKRKLRMLCCTTLIVIAATACSGSEPHRTQTPQTASHFGVGLYDVAAKSFRSIATEHPLSRAEWVKDGETFLAFDTSDRRVRIFDLNGSALQTLPDVMGDRQVLWFSPAPGSDGFLVSFTGRGQSMVWLDAQTLQSRSFTGPPGVNSNPTFSVAGDHVAYVNNDGDSSSIVLAKADGSDYKVLISESDPDRSLSIGSSSWSPDGRWILVSTEVCPRNGDAECHKTTGYRSDVIDLDGRIVWTRESTSLDLPTWFGPSRLVVDDRTDILSQPMTFVDIPSGVASPAPGRVLPGSAAAPNGQLMIVGSLYDCALVSVGTGAISVANAGCGLDDWTADSSLALVWDTICSSASFGRPDDCVAGRAQDPSKATPTATSAADVTKAVEDVYTPGTACDVNAKPSASLTPANETPVSIGTPTPQYYASLRKFYEGRSRVTYRVCSKIGKTNVEYQVVWYKDGVTRARYEIPAILTAKGKAFDLMYFVDGDHRYVCGSRLGRYLSELVPPDGVGDLTTPSGKFGKAVQRLSGLTDTCVQDDHGALFFDFPFGEHSLDDVLKDAGLTDPRTADLASLDRGDAEKWGSYNAIGTRQIAGIEASCYAFYGAEKCFSRDGTLLFSQSHSRIEAIEVAGAGERDFELPHPPSETVGRCFPEVDPTPEPTIDVAQAVRDKHYEPALRATVLKLSDLACGWRDGTSQTARSLRCADALEVGAIARLPRVSSRFNQIRPVSSGSYPEDFVGHQLWLSSAGEVSQLFDQVADYYVRCDGYSFTNDRGDVITVHTRRFDLDQPIGDASFGILMTFNYNPYGDWAIIVSRRGPLISSLQYYDGSLGIRDPEYRKLKLTAERLAKTLDSRMTQLAQLLGQ